MTAACACAGVGVVPPLPQGFTGVVVPDPDGEVNHLAEPRVLKPAIIVFGFAAAGSEGKASSVARGGAAVLEFVVFCLMVEAVVGEGREELRFVLATVGTGELPHAGGVETAVGRGPLILFELVADKAGNGSR
jgi:hypothetical protein